MGLTFEEINEKYRIERLTVMTEEIALIDNPGDESSFLYGDLNDTLETVGFTVTSRETQTCREVRMEDPNKEELLEAILKTVKEMEGSNE